MKRAYLYAGLPGAGKTTAAQVGKELTGGTYLETGDVLRDMYESSDEPDSKGLGAFAAEQREKKGNAFATLQLIKDIIDGEREIDWPLHLSGVRHVDEVAECRKFFDDTYLYYVSAPFHVRLERLKTRAREGEGDFDAGDLLERDKRELRDLGTNTIRTQGRVDERIFNYTDYEDLNEEVRYALNNNDLR